MKVTQLAGPTTPQLPGTTTKTSYSQAAKDLFNKNKAEMERPSEAPKAIESIEETAKVTPIEASSSEEKPVEATPAPAAEEESISSQFAALARKEKAQRARVQAEQAKLKAERDSLEAEKASLQSQRAEMESKSKSSPGVNDLDLTPELYEQLTERMLAQQSNPMAVQQAQMIKQLESKLAAMEQSQKKSFEDLQRDNEKAALNQISFDVKQTIKGNPEFETIEKTGSFSDVVELIEKTFKEGRGEDYPAGTVMDTHTAAKIVEADLEEQLYKYASSVSKISKRFQPKAEASQTVTQSQSGNKEPELKTLTNKVTSSKPLSSRERAIRAFRGISND